MTRRWENRAYNAADITVQDLASLSPADLVRAQDEIRERLRDIHEDQDGRPRDKIADGTQAEFSRLLELSDRIEAHLRIHEGFRNKRAWTRGDNPGDGGSGPRPGRRSGPELMRRVEPWLAMSEIARLADDEARDRALGALEERGEDLGLTSGQLDQADELLRSVLSAENPNCDGSYIARRTLITESPAYRSAFRELMINPHPLLTAEEVEAVRALRALEASEFRAMGEGSIGAGLAGVPVFIDPTIILTSGAGQAPILDVCRTARITTNQWKGVTSAGVTWSWDAEGSAVSDDSPTLAQPAVPVYMGRGFLPYSIELGQDYPGFADEMATLLTQGSLDLLAASTATGSGTNQPTGIVTKLEATTTSRVRVTTAGAVAAQDVFNVWNSLPERFRSAPSAGWGMSVSMESQIRSFSSANQSSAYFTVNLADEGITYLNGKKVTRPDYFPTFVTGSTSTRAFCVVGAWENYLVAMRAGMSIEPIQTLFDVSTARPTGQRGFFAWMRSGHDCVNPAGFRVLDQT